MSDIELKERRFEGFSLEQLDEIYQGLGTCLYTNKTLDQIICKELMQEIGLELGLRDSSG